MVLLHAGVADRRMWAAHLPPLARAGFRAIAIDLPGFGQAQPGERPAAPWSDVLVSMDELGVDRAALVGNSFGGAVALRVAVLAPERVGALALISSPAPGVEPSSRLLEAWEAEEGALQRGDIDGAVDAVVRAWTLPGAPSELCELIAAMQRRALELQLEAGEPPEGPDPLERDPAALARLAVPALVAVGELDMSDFHRAAEKLAGTLPQAQLSVIAGAGHFAPLETPEAFRELLLDFLGG